MKATLGMNYRLLATNLETMSKNLYRLREQAATGKQMNRPSDNPSAIRPVLNYRVQSQTTDRYLDHMAVASGELQVLDSSMDLIENLMVNAKEVALAAMNGTSSDADLRTYADQIAQLFDELVQASNAEVNGKFIFAGYNEATTPFSEHPGYDPMTHDPADPATWPVGYSGDAHVKTVEIAPEKRIQTSLAGSELFLGDADNSGETDTGGIDLFAVLKDFEHALRTNDRAAMDSGLDQLEKGAEQVRRLRGKMGNNAWRIERANQHLENISLEFREILSGYEDADILTVYSDLVRQETAFEAALNVTARVSKLSILDFM